MIRKLLISFVTIGSMLFSLSLWATPIYLNIDNISVSVGTGTSPGSFNNTFAGGNTIDKVIDAPTADASEFHNQTTHIWFTADTIGGGLELVFDFGVEYDITTLHFWNYNFENFDVDNIDFTFFNAANNQVGTLGVMPALGANPAILAQDLVLAAPLNVRFVRAFLTGSNRQVDFQNIGFTAELSTPTNPNSVPEPSSILLTALALLGIRLSKYTQTT